jgi:trigger factor
LGEALKQTLEVTVPAVEVESEVQRVVSSLQKKVRIPGFRPGKVPAEIIRRRFAGDVRQEVVEALVNKHFWKRAEEEGLAVAGVLDITDVHFQPGEPLRFKAAFEVAPRIELKEYKGLTVAYQDPEVTEEDLRRRLEEVREQKADYINVDARPVEDGDFAVVALESLAGVPGPPVRQDELMLHIGDPETLEAFSRNLRGLVPPAESEFEVHYPDDYGQARLAGRSVRFRARLKGIRRKQLPELNDEFAQDLGDYQTLEELREALRRSLFFERQVAAQHAAKEALVDRLVELHEFPVPEAYVERQIELLIRRHLERLAAQGVDPSSVKIDWERVKQSQRERAVREVKASLLLDRIAEVEAIIATTDEVEREVQRIARQEREPAPAVRARLEKEGGLARIAARIRTEKTLNLLFEQARKTAPE